MVVEGIKIFARLKPTKAKMADYDVTTDETSNKRYVSFVVPKDLQTDYINNKRDQFKFNFKQIFEPNCTQDVVFTNVAKDVIDNCLRGFNGTIFAYGQTGSGKTFTITGGAERYSDRGIIPRSLSYLFETFEATPEMKTSAQISYLEVYNENGYDLLDPKHEASKLEDLPKVTLMEDPEQNIHLRNLNLHQAANVEDALNLLFIGDTNRMIAETPMNQASTRSHCIFTVHIQCRDPGSTITRRSKLHLVDLAGSERVYKTGNVAGNTLTEAKYINLSLHYLEQVIVALSEKQRKHIPYRNSMMTSVLRDSLGGNCKTTMIATLSVDHKNLAESISTCRFAQRVALIKNEVTVNEEVDPKLVILRLKNEIKLLKCQLDMSDIPSGSLTSAEVDNCTELTNNYSDNPDPEVILNVGSDLRKVNMCFSIMKTIIVSLRDADKKKDVLGDDVGVIGSYLDGNVPKLQDLVKQRDNEINILIAMLKKERSTKDLRSEPVSQATPHLKSAIETPDGVSRQDKLHPLPLKSKLMLSDMSIGKKEAFEVFRANYPLNEEVDSQKIDLKKLYIDAKTIGENINWNRKRVNRLKNDIELLRLSNSLNREESTEEEEQLRLEVEKEKEAYKSNLQVLRKTRNEIEHCQHLLENSKLRMHKDFAAWWDEQCKLLEQRDRAAITSNAAPLHDNTYSPLNYANVSNDASAGHFSKQTAHSVHQPGQLSHHKQAFRHPGKNYGHPDYHLDASSGSTKSNGNSAVHPEPLKVIQTGDAQADADILAFVQARRSIMSKTKMASKRQ